MCPSELEVGTKLLMLLLLVFASMLAGSMVPIVLDYYRLVKKLREFEADWVRPEI